MSESDLSCLVLIQKDQIILYDIYRAFAADSLVSSHPLSCKEEEVNTPSEITQMFNSISYSKVRWFIVFNRIAFYILIPAQVFFMGSVEYLLYCKFIKVHERYVGMLMSLSVFACITGGCCAQDALSVPH